MLRFATFLSPVLYDTYAHITRYVGGHLNVPITLHVGQSLDEFATGQADVGFLCGLLYANMPQPRPVELLMAPVVVGERYHGEPLYYSDVIVRRDSSYTSFDALQGARWAFNEEASHSGYNIVSYSLLMRGKTFDHFGSMLKTGSHFASMQAVLDGKADAAAIDSHVLDVWFQQKSELVQQLRVVDMLGPSTIPPIVASTHVDTTTMHRVQEILCTMHKDVDGARDLHAGLIERLVPIVDRHYDDVRCMFARVQERKMSTVPCR
ncbi:MAG: hypothetical protein NVSMB38_13180 [Ktedonobacteraceae bacterium]